MTMRVAALDPKDCVLSGPRRGFYTTIEHLPTRIVVEVEGTGMKNELFAALQVALDQHAAEQSACKEG